MNSRGFSTIIATILIILLTVIAAAMIAQVVIPFAKKNLYKSTECISYEHYFQFDNSLEWNCYNASTRQITVSITAQNDPALAAQVAGFKLALLGEGISKTVDVREGSSASTIRNFGKQSGSKLTIPHAGDTSTYIYDYGNDGVQYYTGADIHTVLASGRLCEKPSGHVTLLDCRGKI